MTPKAELFHYHLDWRADGRRSGDHPGVGSGEDGHFRSHRPLASASDARRIDVRASIVDPLSRWWVREHQIRASITVWLLADVSASMRLPGSGSGHGTGISKAELLAQLTLSCAHSSHRAGDRFGLLSAANELDFERCLPASRLPAQAQVLAARMRELATPGGPTAPRPGSGLDSVNGLLRAAGRIGHSRSLVFIASDFHGPDQFWRELIRSMSRHQVIAVVLRDDAELRALPSWGLIGLIDAESGRTRPMLMRPSLKQRMTDALRARDQKLQQLFAEQKIASVWFDGQFGAAQITRLFFGAGSRASHATADTNRNPPPPGSPATARRWANRQTVNIRSKPCK